MTLDDLSDARLPQLPARPVDSHKGDFGRALLVGGSRGMCGAISLAGMAALRSGAGLVTLVVPRSTQDVIATFEPSYMTRGLTDVDGLFADRAADEILELSQTATTLALGPGIGRSEAITNLITRLYLEIEKPMVVDADGLFALAERVNVLERPGGPRVITPHPGEFARLSPGYDAGRRAEAAASLAARDPARTTIVVLKGPQTVVTDGWRMSKNKTGNPGMATGGTGDVLSGVITALMCQGLSPFDAARLGVHVHGQAGDLAAKDLGQVSMIASDLVDYLPKAFRLLR